MIAALPRTKRYYLAQVVGCGTERDPYRAVVADYCQQYASIIAERPGARLALCVVRADSIVHSLLTAMPNVRRLPDDRDEITRLGRKIEPGFELEQFGVWV